MSNTPAYPPEENLPPFSYERTLKYTQSPNPTWSYGQGLSENDKGREWLAGEKDGWSVFNPEETELR